MMAQTLNPLPIQILVAEDDPLDVDILRRAFSKAKAAAHLHVVGDGESALAFLRREPPHQAAPRPQVIVLDINMPGRSGIEILADIKNDPNLRAIPVIILTSSRDEAEVRRSYEHHAAAYIPKPLTAEQMTDIAETLDSLWTAIVKL